MDDNLTKKLKPVQITDQKAIQIIRDMAKRNSRSLSNAAAFIIKESLGTKNEHTKMECHSQ